MNPRSLRIRLCILYVLFTTATMIGLGGFSYWYLDQVLASSSQHTMDAREDRLVRFVNTWPGAANNVTLVDKLRQLNLAIASTDIIQVHDLKGDEVYSSPGPEYLKIPWPASECRQRCYGLVRRSGHNVRTLDHVVALEGHEYRMSLSGKIDEHYAVLNMIRNSYLLLCPLMVLLSIGGGFVLSGRALEPIHRITTEARSIGIQDLKRRIPVPRTGDELQVLAETWNQLLERLETAVERLMQFTGDISHDLNTTITIMMTTAGLALSRERSPEEYRTALHSINVECDATAQILGTLLAIARTDLVQQKIEWKPLNLTGVATEIAQQFEARAALKKQKIQLEVQDEAWTNGDLSLLRRMLSILVDNAIKYTPEGGLITISLEKSEDYLQIQVSDTGVGIPAHALPRVFDRFYRVDASRAGSGESNGLGLAIAKWVAEAHLSTIDVVSAPGRGTTFTVSIPRTIEPEISSILYAPSA